MKNVEKEFEQINDFVNRQWERTIGLANYQSLLTGWAVGSFVSARLKSASWGSGTVDALVDYLKTRNPGLRGYGRRNIYNMVLFYDTYAGAEFERVHDRLKLGDFVQTASAQIGQEQIVQTASARFPSTFRSARAFPAFLSLTTFSNHLEILGRCRTMDESSEVSYTLCRSMSPMMVAEYQRLLVPKEVMKKSLDEYCVFLKREAKRGRKAK